MDNNVLGLKANQLITDTALRGGCSDSDGGILMDWKAVGRYMVVYIENRDNGETYYRVFRFPGKRYYDYKLIMRPSYIAGAYQRIYDSTEDGKGHWTMHHAGELEWMEMIRKEIYC